MLSGCFGAAHLSEGRRCAVEGALPARLPPVRLLLLPRSLSAVLRGMQAPAMAPACTPPLLLLGRVVAPESALRAPPPTRRR